MGHSSAPSHSDAGASSSPDGSGSSRLRRWGRRAAWTVGGLVGGVLLLLGALLLFLQTETGATAAAQFLADRVNPLPGTEITIERASGSWIRSLRLTNVSLTRTDSTTGQEIPMAHVDTLAAEYRLGALLDGRLHLTDVSVAEPTVTMRQAPDSSWDWGRVLPTSSEPDTTSAMPIQVDRARLTRGSLTAEFYADDRDSTAQVHDIRLLAHDLHTAPTTTGEIDTLGLRGHLPADTTDLRLSARGALSSSHLQIDTLRLDSPRSQVYGAGQVRLPEDSEEQLDDVDLTLQAAPLAFQDLATVVPTLDVDPSETLELDAHVTGSGRRLTLTADAAFSGGGTVSARAAATPATEVALNAPPLHYHLDAEIRDLTTSLLGPLAPAENQLTASVQADLQGQTLSTMDGSGTVHLQNTRSYGIHIPELALRSTVRDGTAHVDLEGTLNDASIVVRGQTRPFDESLSTSLTAHVAHFNVASFAPDAELETDVTASAQIEGRDLGASTAEVDATVDLGRSQVGLQQINDGGLSLALEPDQARFEGSLTLPAGQVQTSGSARLDGSEQFTLETGHLDNLNVAALAGDTTESRVTGTFRAQGQGFSPETMQLEASLSLQDSHYGPHQLSSLKTSADLADGRLTANASARLNGSSWTLAATSRPFDTTPTAEITRGRFEDVDIGPFLQDTTQSSDLHGTLRGSIQGTTPSTLQMNVGLTLDSSRVNRQLIQSASLDARLREGRFTTDLDLDLPNGATRLAATARPFDEVPTYRITEGSFDNVNVGAFMNMSALTTRLTGTLTLQGRGTEASTLSLSSDLSFTDSRINQASLTDGRLAVSTENRRITANGTFDVAGGQIRLAGAVDNLDATPAYTLQTEAGRLDMGALAGLDTLSAHLDSLRWTLDGRGTNLESATASTELGASSIRVGRFRIENTIVTGRLQEGVFSLDTLAVQSNAFVSTGEGTLALTSNRTSSNLGLETRFTDADPLRRLLGAEFLQLQGGVLETYIYGSTTQQRFDGSLEGDSFAYNDIRLSDVEIDFYGQRGTDQLFQRLEVGGSLGYLSVPGLVAEQARLQARYDGSTIGLSTNVTVDQQHTASLKTTIHPRAEQTDVTLHQLNLRLGPDRWSLLQDATVTVGDQYRISGFLLSSGTQQIAADGVVDPNGPQSLVATIENFRLGGVAPLMGLTGLDGTLTGTLDLTGAAADPQLDGRLAVDIRSEDQEVGTLNLDVGYDDFSLSLDARLTHTDGGVFTASGSIPADLRLSTPTAGNVFNRSVRLDLSTDRFPVNWIDPFLDPETAQDVTGTLAADVEVRGTLDQPELDGTASLTEAGARLPDLGTRYRNGQVALTLSEDRITLDKAVLRSTNDGRLRAKGVIQFPQLTVGALDLEIDASNFLALNTNAYRRVVLNSSMTLKGTTQQPELDGAVQIQSANVHYEEALAESSGMADVTLTEEDRITLEQRFGLRLTDAETASSDVYEAMAMDLTVLIQRDTWLRSMSNPEMNIQFTGDLDLTKEPQQDAQVFGTIQVMESRSTVRQFGQEFQITEGTVTFNGDPTVPQLDLTAEYEQRAREAQGSEVRITLSLSGRPDNLTHELQSDPQMDTRNILSYLATGRPADQLFSGGTGNGGNLATQVALGQATNIVENLAASELGLDVVRLDFRTEGFSYLTVGRYVTSRFFVSVEQPLVTSSFQGRTQSVGLIPDLTLEYHLTDYLLLRSLSSQQSFQLNFLLEYAY